MKIKMAIATLCTFSVLSFAAVAADTAQVKEINAAQANRLQPIGVISVAGLDGTEADIGQQLATKTRQQGASAFHIIEERIDGNYHATALIYR
ncbi:YdgH/BhsA/McbA-like domain containing protein [Edwardsiella tarda]|uniref:YdgH/BhsA/McbA-like domain containing protein n=1 Tax=Edwardsiella tarda TaxID=636 RepID=UPI00351C5A81